MAKSLRSQNSHKEVAEEFDGYADSYSDAVNEALILPGMNVDYFARVKAEFLKDFVAVSFPKPEEISVLDVGCGVGIYHQLLANQFGRLVGVDVSIASVEKAAQSNPGSQFLTYDGQRLPFEDACFEVAFAICVVHHVPVEQWNNFFCEMYRVLKPGGFAMIFEHNPYNPLTRRIVDRCPFDKDATLLGKRKTRSLLRQAGFHNLRARSILNMPSFGRLTRRMDLVVGLLPTGAQYLAIGQRPQELPDCAQ